MKQIKIIVEKHSDGYVAYPLGIKEAIALEEIGELDRIFTHINAMLVAQHND
ncbi:hypothetical protein [Nostoc sp. NMS4]|uniref:hypothetical protein n=1 Tax=Nostoc sp. NMS4 TaxID=2815390 RepID=UPI0025E321FA|nr:hypothetical protein [Nostoc sp. NMS4]MBN3925792.1 hypothetical protein [Nostoc sp. NMS4]